MRFCFISRSFFRELVFLRHFMELLLSEWQLQLFQTAVSRWWQKLCCGLMSHSVIVLWEVIHLPRLCALKMIFI